jgi:glycosyltransferase involved in cell wall biosynthesis
MRVITVYNYYRNRGGEDEVFDAEAALLESHGHDVIRYSKQNKDIDGMSPILLGSMTLWNQGAYKDLRELIRQRQPDLVHFHNTFPLISPAAYYAVKNEGLPVVQTLHNFRMICPNALLYRDGGVCEECIGRTLPWPGIYHGCYQDSRTASAGVAGMLALHHMLMTWRKKVDIYIALTDFARAKFIEGGLPAEKIVVKPNFVNMNTGVETPEASRRYALFVGRLSENKGILTLLQAWKKVNNVLALKVVGTGPLAETSAAAVAELPGVELTGRMAHADVLKLMRGAVAVIVPSTWYEGMPMTIIEAYAAGVPVIASNLGSMASAVRDGETGLLFEPGNSDELAKTVLWLIDHPVEMMRMRVGAREEFQLRYTPEINYLHLMNIYERVLNRVRPKSSNGKSAMTQSSAGELETNTYRSGSVK